MKINARDLIKHLDGKLKSVYWISGDESFLVSQTVKDIEKKIKQQGFEIERESVSTTFKADRFFELTHEMSLFANQRCIIFSCENRLNPALTKALEAYCKSPSPDIVLIFYGGKLASNVTSRAWYKAFDKIGMHIPIWPIDHAQLPKFLIDHARRFNLNLETDAANLLANMTEGNLFSANQTLEKLSSLNPNERITVEMLHANAEDQAHFDVFDLISAILKGELQRSNRILQNLFATGCEPNIILWAIVKELRLLATLFEQRERTPLSTLFKQHNIWEKRGREIQTALNRLSYQKCLGAIQDAAEIDRILKGYKTGDTQLKLSQLVNEV